MNKKYFFFDIDGTLAVGEPGDQYIPESTKKALQMLRDNGHFLAIATGRGYGMAKDYMETLGFENMISDGGNGITLNKELLSIEPLDKEKCLKLIEELEEKNIAWALSADEKMRRLAPNERFHEETQDTYMKTEVVEGLDPQSFKEIKKVFIACERGVEDTIDMLKELPFVRFHDEYLFVEPDDKSVGIKKVMDHFKADYKDVVVFGDEKNDLKMFRDEWLSIAMGNAIDELKEKATYVTSDVDKDGIYNACKHFGWID